MADKDTMRLLLRQGKVAALGTRALTHILLVIYKLSIYHDCMAFSEKYFLSHKSISIEYLI